MSAVLFGAHELGPPACSGSNGQRASSGRPLNPDRLTVEYAGSSKDAAFVGIGGLSIDRREERNGQVGVGPKPETTRFTHSLGGSAPNVSSQVACNGVASAAIGVQAADWVDLTCRKLAKKKVIPYVMSREDEEEPATATIRSKGIEVQRMSPPKVSELDEVIQGVISRAFAIFFGPMAWTASTRELFSLVSFLAASRAKLALTPHISLLKDYSSFTDVVRRVDYVQMNYVESCHLLGSAGDPKQKCETVARMMKEGAACAITNGPAEGWLWSNNRMIPINPIPIDVVDETGGGDAFTGAVIFGSWFEKLSEGDVVGYAVKAAAAAVTQRGFDKPLRYERSDVFFSY